MIALATHGYLTHMPSFILRQAQQPLARALYTIMTSPRERVVKGNNSKPQKPLARI